MDMIGDGFFEMIVGLWVMWIVFNVEMIDVISIESEGCWCEFLGGVGVCLVIILGLGVFCDGIMDEWVW